MGYKVTLDVGRQYTGCKELIPGCVYLDNKGNKILFVGYGDLSTISWGSGKSFIYMKVDQIEKKIAKGKLSKDIKDYYGEDMEASMLFYASDKPRLLKSFEYQMFPSDYFERFELIQHFDDGNFYPTFVQVKPIIRPYVCTVEKV